MQKKGILTDTLFQFSFFKPYVVAINLLPQPPYYYTKNQYLVKNYIVFVFSSYRKHYSNALPAVIGQ